MSRFEELVAEHCPDGVRFARLGDVCAFNRGKWVKADSLQPGSVPVVTSSRTISAYHSTSNRKGTTVVVASSGAYAGYVSIWKEPIYLSNAFSVDVKDSSVLSPEFVYLCLQGMQGQLHGLASGAGVPNIYGSDIASIKIPVPPVEVQTEVVRILDMFSQLEAELEAELEARRCQYTHYRTAVLNELRASAPSTTVAASAYVGTGSSDRKDATADGRYPLYVRSKSVLRTDSFEFDDTAIVIPGEGGIGDIFHYVEGKYALHQRAYRIVFRSGSGVYPRFAFHVFQEDFKPFILSKAVSATVSSIRKPMIETFTIPVPPMEVQIDIAQRLDAFSALVEDLSSGLPAEIAARRKQYEYYRERLLTFKELAS